MKIITVGCPCQKATVWHETNCEETVIECYGRLSNNREEHRQELVCPGDKVHTNTIDSKIVLGDVYGSSLGFPLLLPSLSPFFPGSTKSPGKPCPEVRLTDPKSLLKQWGRFRRVCWFPMPPFDSGYIQNGGSASMAEYETACPRNRDIENRVWVETWGRVDAYSKQSKASER